jgi:hypothetical protein
VSKLKLTALILDHLFADTSQSDHHSHRKNLRQSAAQYLAAIANEFLLEDKVLVNTLITHTIVL